MSILAESDFIRVDEWEPSDEDYIIQYDGKLVIIPFDEIFRQDASIFNTFVIKKKSYASQLPDITHYLNYFIKFYDTNNELLMMYLMLKHQIDNKKKKIKRKAFIKMMYTIIFTDSIIDKISRMVEDNYYIDVKSKKSKIKYSETLEFTNEHAKIMMKISMGMKLMVPVLFHYLNRNSITKDEMSLFTYYENLFYMFNGDVDIYRKLWITASAKIKKHYSRNMVIWNQREILGVDPQIIINDMLKINIISETMVRYRFYKSIVAFNSVILDRQLMFFSITKYDHTMREVSGTKDPEGLSGLDKLEMSSAKVDESLVILSSVNIKEGIKKLQKTFNIKIDKDEARYYEERHEIHKFQVQLVNYFYAKYFGGYRDLSLLTKRQYIRLMVLLKRRLQYQGFTYLPQIFSSNVTRLVKRTIRNQKFLDKITTSPVYQQIITEKFDTLDDLNKGDFIINILSILLNSKFTFVDYDVPEKFGEEIDIVTPDILSDEFLNFLNQI